MADEQYVVESSQTGNRVKVPANYRYAKWTAEENIKSKVIADY